MDIPNEFLSAIVQSSWSKTGRRRLLGKEGDFQPKRFFFRSKTSIPTTVVLTNRFPRVGWHNLRRTSQRFSGGTEPRIKGTRSTSVSPFTDQPPHDSRSRSWTFLSVKAARREAAMSGLFGTSAIRVAEQQNSISEHGRLLHHSSEVGRGPRSHPPVRVSRRSCVAVRQAPPRWLVTVP